MDEHLAPYVPILEGPKFREFWEERLTPEARKEVQRAVAAGEALPDPGLASVAVSYARKELKLPKFLTSLLLIAWAGSLFFLVWIFSLPSSPNILLYRIIAVVWALVLPTHLVLYWFVRRPRFKRAELSNLRMLQQAK